MTDAPVSRYPVPPGVSIAAGVTTHILSLRVKTTFGGQQSRPVVFPRSFAVMAESKPIRYSIILGGSLAGASWADVATNYSMLEYSQVGTLTGGVVVAEGLVVASSTQKDVTIVGVTSRIPLSLSIDGSASNILTIVAKNVDSAGNALVRAVTNWGELR